MRVGTEPFLALREDYGERLLILDAADVPTPEYGPTIGSVPSLAASLRALAASVRPSPSAATARATCAEAQRSLARGLAVEMERYAGTRPWHIGRAIAALSERLTPEMVVTSDVSNVKLWLPFQLRTFGPHSHVQAGSWGTMGYALAGRSRRRVRLSRPQGRGAGRRRLVPDVVVRPGHARPAPVAGRDRRPPRRADRDDQLHADAWPAASHTQPRLARSTMRRWPRPLE